MASMGEPSLSAAVAARPCERVQVDDVLKRAATKNGHPSIKVAPQDRVLGRRVRFQRPDDGLRCYHCLCRSGRALWCDVARARPLIPFAPLQHAPTCLRSPAAPLFEEEGNIGTETLVAYVLYPLLSQGARARATLAAYDHPIQTGKVQTFHRPEQWLDRQEAHGGRALP